MARQHPNRIHLDLNLLGVGSLDTLHGILENELAVGGHENDKKGKMELILNKHAVMLVREQKAKERKK